MAGSNVELHRQAGEAFNRRDVDAYLAFCDPQIELHSAVTVPGGAVYYGHEGVRRWHRDLEEAFGSELRVEPEAYFDLGEHTISFHRLTGRGYSSGADVGMPAAHLCRWRDGLIVYFQGYSDCERAFTDLGTSREAHDPIMA